LKKKGGGGKKKKKIGGGSFRVGESIQKKGKKTVEAPPQFTALKKGAPVSLNRGERGERKPPASAPPVEKKGKKEKGLGYFETKGKKGEEY